MSELKDIWKKLSADKLEVTANTGAWLWPLQSRHPAKKLQNGFRLGLVISLVFEILFGWLLFTFQQLEVRLFLGLVMLGYVFFFLFNLRVYRKISKELDFSQNVHLTLSNIYHLASGSLAFQRKVALFIYPVAASAGFLVGLASRKETVTLFEEPRLILLMVVTSLVLTPVGHFVAVWMEKATYGKYCDQLKGIIDNLEKAETA